jgi:hypothetical protein
MSLNTWADANRTDLENLEVHLLHWQEWFLVPEPLLIRHAANQSLQASLSRHLDLSPHTLALLEQQRSLLAQLEAQVAKRRAGAVTIGQRTEGVKGGPCQHVRGCCLVT